MDRLKPCANITKCVSSMEALRIARDHDSSLLSGSTRTYCDDIMSGVTQKKRVVRFAFHLFELFNQTRLKGPWIGSFEDLLYLKPIRNK